MEKGFHKGISNADYHNDTEWLSSSQIKIAGKNIADFHDQVILGNKKEKKSNAMSIGTIVHSKVLEPETFDSLYAVLPKDYDGRTKAGKEAIARATEQYPGVILISFDDSVLAEAINANVRAYEASNSLLSGGEAETSIYFEHEGQRMRVRPDYMNKERGYIFDLKTTSDLDKHAFYNKARYDYGYFLSAYMYLEAIKNLTGEIYDYYFIVVSTIVPNSVAVYKLSADSLAIGKLQFDDACKKIKDGKVAKDYRYQKEIEPI